MSGHLGEFAAALVDGELGHEARERTLVHLTRCAECRVEVDGQRRLKAGLAGLDNPSPPAALVDRLLALSAGLPPAAPPDAAPPVRRPGVVRRSMREAGRRPPVRRVSRTYRGRRIAAGVGAMVSLTVGGAFVLGGGDDASVGNGGPGVNPSTVNYVVQHTRTSVQVPLQDPAISVLPVVAYP